MTKLRDFIYFPAVIDIHRDSDQLKKEAEGPG